MSLTQPKRLIPWLRAATFALFLWSCDDDEAPLHLDGVLIADTPNRNVFFTLSLSADDSTHLVVPQVDSIQLRVDGQLWGYFLSDTIDTAKVVKKANGRFYTSPLRYEYLANDQYPTIGSAELETAGDVADALATCVDLRPGDHVGQLTSCHVSDRDGQTNQFFPFQNRTFHVEEQDELVFIGHFELTVTP